MSNEVHLNNPNNIVGMSYLLNQDLISNSIKPEIIEKHLIDNSINNDYNNIDNKIDNNSNPIMEYEQQLNNVMYNNNDNSTSNSDFNSSLNNENSFGNLNNINENNYINTDDVASEFDEFDQLLKSVNSNDNKINNNNNNYNEPIENNYNINSYNTNNNSSNSLHTNSYLHDDEISKAIQDEEKKIILLEKIDILKEDLNRDGINLNKIKNVGYDSSLDEIDQVYRILLIKNNRDRYRELAEDVILTVSNGLERIFDGENEYFGMQPDLTGYSDTVRVKLRRLRYETSTIAGNIMEKYELSPMTRIFIELIPSAFIHSSLRNKHNKEKIKYEKNNMDDVMSSIRDNE